MSRPAPVYQWTDVVGSHFPRLSKPQATVLALLSLGMVMAGTCALSAVSLLLAGWEGRSFAAVRQPLREWCYDAADKRGRRRRAVAVSRCFVPLLCWAVEGYTGKQLALALDASSLSDRFVVLALSVLYRGCAVPVAWKIVAAGKPGSWRPHWLELLRQVQGAVPPDWTVIVLADRGLYARWLFQACVRLGWHPFLRVNVGGMFQPDGMAGSRPFKYLVPQVATAWAGTGTAFATPESRLRCTLLVRWEAGYRDPWLVLTDLPPQASEACWYGLRAWIEQGFKRTKRGGWQWQRTRMTDPARAERLWLALAVATLWLVRVGGEADAANAESTLLPVGGALRAARRRPTSIFRRGWMLVLVAVLRGDSLPRGTFAPEPWPSPRPLTPALHSGLGKTYP